VIAYMWPRLKYFSLFHVLSSSFLNFRNWAIFLNSYYRNVPVWYP
jgi:hypothetical protein